MAIVTVNILHDTTKVDVFNPANSTSAVIHATTHTVSFSSGTVRFFGTVGTPIIPPSGSVTFVITNTLANWNDDGVWTAVKTSVNGISYITYFTNSVSTLNITIKNADTVNGVLSVDINFMDMSKGS